MKRTIIAVGLIAIFAAACSSNTGAVNTTPTPSAVISSAASVVNQAICDAQTKALQFVSQVQSGQVPPMTDATATLGEIQGTLDTQASNLESQGQDALAATVRILANAVGQLKTAVENQSTATMISAATKVGTAIASLPACPA
jgi:hypothetical protein